jgi:hypothetical protein
MVEDLAPAARDAERAELLAVTKALARYPRLSGLVRYLGERSFSGMFDEITEYNIATEVFGRSKTVFNAGEDSIVRVEAYRLRKKLKKYYETEGKNHAVQLSMPSGTYIPVFTHLDQESLSRSISDSPGMGPEQAVLPHTAEDAPSPTPKGIGSERALQFLHRRWLYLLLSVVLVFSAFGIFQAIHSAAIPRGIQTGSSSTQPPSAGQTVLSNAASVPLRMIAGFSGSPQTDSEGNVWKADQYFTGGQTWVRPAGFVARTSDSALFRQWRMGDFHYDIPLPPGVYELHLYFVASDRQGDGLATFSLAINGEKVLSDFDVVTDALGEDVMDERVWRDVSPARDGMVHLDFVSQRGVPILNALEVLPGTAHKQLPIRLLTQPTPFRDHNGNLWQPDTYFTNGKLSAQQRMAEGSPDPGLYAAERYGHFTYAIPVDTRGRYTLVLHFAEFYFGTAASGTGGTGGRVFRVLCNGNTLLDNFDIFKEAGSLHALTKTFYHLKPTAQGKLNITFEPVVNFATVSAIEVLDESQ